MKRLAAAAGVAVALVVPRAAAACAVCYGAADSAMTEGLNAAILVLLAIVAAVQVGFVALFVRFRRRSREIQMRKDSFQLIDGGVT